LHLLLASTHTFMLKDLKSSASAQICDWRAQLCCCTSAQICSYFAANLSEKQVSCHI
jgi:hypothetical protein